MILTILACSRPLPHGHLVPLPHIDTPRSGVDLYRELLRSFLAPATFLKGPVRQGSRQGSRPAFLRKFCSNLMQMQDARLS